MRPHRYGPITRRRFLVGGGAVTGAVLLGSCGDDEGDPSTTGPSASSDLALAQFFGASMLVAGTELRAPFGVADADGVLPLEDTPESLQVTVLDPAGAQVGEALEVRRHAAGLPRPYFPLRVTVDEPGIYTARAEVEGEGLEMAMQVAAAKDVSVIQPGVRLPAIDTPTTADARGVDPICTAKPVCPLHDVTVATALEEGQPLALLIATPAFCQVAICGPVLDVLLAVADDHPDVRLLHAEVYVDPGKDIDTKAPVIDDLGLTFEPCLVLVGSDGRVVERLDTVFDEREVSDALAAIS